MQAKEDVIKLLLSLPQVRSTEACPVTKSQIQLKTPVDNVPVYLTVSSDLVPESDAARKNQKIFAFMVTLRSPNLALLMAIRASTKARLEVGIEFGMLFVNIIFVFIRACLHS